MSVKSIHDSEIMNFEAAVAANRFVVIPYHSDLLFMSNGYISRGAVGFCQNAKTYRLAQ